MRKFHQDKSEEEFRVHCNIIHQRMQEEGLFLPEFNTLATVSTLRGVEYDEMRDQVYKVYTDECLTVPVNVCMRKRSAAHPLNVNERCNAAHGRITAKAPALCFNQGLLGVIGTVKGTDPKRQQVRLVIDRASEEAKIHNPFLAENFLRRELVSQGQIDSKGKATQVARQSKRQYCGDAEIE